MNGSVNTLGTEQQTSTAKQSVTPAESVTMLGISKQDISRLGGIWPPVGTTQRTDMGTSKCSVLPAICTNKDGSGISVEDLTKLSVDELRALCGNREYLGAMESQSCENAQTTTNHKQNDSFYRSLQSMSEKEKQRLISELREERRNLLLHEHGSKYNDRVRRCQRKLYALTENTIYYNAYDSA